VTLAIALRCADGLVLATDSRVSGGPRQSADISEKFLQVNRDVGVMTYGLAVPGYRGIRNLVEEVRQNPSQFATMTAITERAQQVFQSEFDAYLQPHRGPDGALPPELQGQGVGYIVGGFDGNDTARFRVMSCYSDSGFEFAEQIRTCLMAAQWPLPVSLLPYVEYPGMSVRHGLRSATMLMILTAAHESTVGGPIHVATVTLEEGFTPLHEREVTALVQDVQPSLLALHRAWLDCWDTP
jgi:20S proteasome alpha/beta subunit